MAISFEELEANREALNGLNFQQLKERLDPASLMDGLRWLPDIQLQQSVAKKLIQKEDINLILITFTTYWDIIITANNSLFGFVTNSF